MALQLEHDEHIEQRVIVDPRILVGKPVIKGTRIPVSLILNLLANGMTFDEIIADYPILTQEDIKAGLLYAAARMDGDEIYPFSGRA